MGQLGQSPDSFWTLTPRQFNAILRRHVQSRDADLDLAFQVAYTTAALGRVKKFPKLKDVLPSKQSSSPKQSRKRSPEHLEALMREMVSRNKQTFKD